MMQTELKNRLTIISEDNFQRLMYLYGEIDIDRLSRLPFVNFHINRNKIFKDSLNNKLRKNLIDNGKLELSENMPPLSDTMKEWETKYVEAHK